MQEVRKYHAGMSCNYIMFLQSFSKIGQPVKILNGAKHTREVQGEKRISVTLLRTHPTWLAWNEIRASTITNRRLTIPATTRPCL
jgi:hypothetical protein